MLISKDCSRCGHKSDANVNLESSQKIKVKKEVAVVTEGENEIHPIVEFTCEKCKNNQAFFWTKQTRASDEAETKFYRCTKCRHTWREYK